jgi:hypothetical protein
MSSQEKIAPCPFCGKQPKLVSHKFYPLNPPERWGLSCKNLFFDCRAKSKDEAIAEWNRRAPSERESKPGPGVADVVEVYNRLNSPSEREKAVADLVEAAKKAFGDFSCRHACRNDCGSFCHYSVAYADNQGCPKRTRRQADRITDKRARKKITRDDRYLFMLLRIKVVGLGADYSQARKRSYTNWGMEPFRQWKKFADDPIKAIDAAIRASRRGKGK